MELHEVKKNLNKTVLYKDKLYTLKACTLYKDKEGEKYSAVLLDKNKNSILSCKLKDVTIKERNYQNENI